MITHEVKDLGNGWGKLMVVLPSKQLPAGWKGRWEALKWLISGKLPKTAEIDTLFTVSVKKPEENVQLYFNIAMSQITVGGKEC